jgi:regulatory protein
VDGPGDVEAARESALKMLSRREHSRLDLATRLTRKGHGEEAVRQALDRLVEVGVVDDARYGREVAVTLLRSGPVSAEHLIARLVSRGLEPEVAREVADATLADVDPVDEAARFASRKLGAMPEPAPAVLRRVASGLARRGFDHETILAALERCGASGEWETEP